MRGMQRWATLTVDPSGLVPIEPSADDRERSANLKCLHDWYTARMVRRFEFYRWLYLTHPEMLDVYPEPPSDRPDDGGL